MDPGRVVLKTYRTWLSGGQLSLSVIINRFPLPHGVSREPITLPPIWRK